MSVRYLLLANPGHNRVYLDSAKGAGTAELALLLPGSTDFAHRSGDGQLVQALEAVQPGEIVN